MIDKAFVMLLEMALEEDLGLRGDITSRALFPENNTCKAVLTS